MDLIISYLARYLPFLWRAGRYQIVASESAASNGGDALLIIASEQLGLRFVCDRRQLFLDCHCVEPPSAWYSIDLVRQLLIGKPCPSAVLDADYGAFLQTHFEEIEQRFDAGSSQETLAALGRLKRARETNRW